MWGLRRRPGSTAAWRNRSSKSGRVAAVSALVAAAALSTLLTAAVLDRAVAFFDLTYTPARGSPNEEQRIERAEFSVDVRLNALGFRERRLPSPKPPGVLRVVTLGDSFTQGYGVEEDEAWPRRLEAALDARDGGTHEVVNLGVPGTNPQDYVSHLQYPGLAYQPDVVIVTVMANDVQDRWVQREFGVQFASDVLVNARRAVLEPSPTWTRIPRAVFPALYALVWSRLRILGAGSSRAPVESLPPDATAAAARSPASGAAEEVLLLLADRYGRRDTVEDAVATMPIGQLDTLRPVLEGTVALDADAATEPYLRVMALVQPRLFADAALLPRQYDAAWKDVQRDLGRIVALARGARARPVLVFAPAAQQVTAAPRPYLESLGFEWDDRTLTDTTLADRLRDFARGENMVFVNLLPVLRARRDDGLYFPKDGHWNSAGHAVVADAVAGALERAARDGTQPSLRASAAGTAR
jgi:lysophospholipase L1-like esterase